MTISSSLDWADRRARLFADIKTLPYSHDLRKMLAAIDTMVSDLGRAEVEARQRRRPISSLEQFIRVNAAITQLEQYIIVASLQQ